MGSRRAQVTLPYRQPASPRTTNMNGSKALELQLKSTHIDGYSLAHHRQTRRHNKPLAQRTKLVTVAWARPGTKAEDDLQEDELERRSQRSSLSGPAIAGTG